MLYGWKENSMLTNCLVACAHLTITVSEIQRDICEKIVILSYPLAFDAPARGFPSEYRHPVWDGKTRMVSLPDGEKISKISVFVLTWSTNVTDRQTDTGWQQRPRLCFASRCKNQMCWRARCKGMKQSTLGIKRSKVKVTWGQRYIWRASTGLILSPLGLIRFSHTFFLESYGFVLRCTIAASYWYYIYHLDVRNFLNLNAGTSLCDAWLPITGSYLGYK